MQVLPPTVLNPISFRDTQTTPADPLYSLFLIRYCAHCLCIYFLDWAIFTCLPALIFTPPISPIFLFIAQSSTFLCSFSTLACASVLLLKPIELSSELDLLGQVHFLIHAFDIFMYLISMCWYPFTLFKDHFAQHAWTCIWKFFLIHCVIDV